MLGLSLPWHKVLNAVVAELSVYKWKNQRGRIDSLLLWVSRQSARQTELYSMKNIPPYLQIR